MFCIFRVSFNVVETYFVVSCNFAFFWSLEARKRLVLFY